MSEKEQNKIDFTSEPQAQPQTVPAAQPAAEPRKSPSDMAIATMQGYVEKGLVLPGSYSFVNAIKSSIMVIAEMRDRDGRSPLETCTRISIQTALVDMAQKGLDVSKGQGYFVKRGNRLVFMKEYHGTTTQIQRMFPDYTPVPRVIYQGDEFEYETDPLTGRRRLVRHVQKLVNIDNDFVGAYLYIPCRDGGQDLYVMTRKMIEEAWRQSSNSSLSVHKRFTDKMVCKTIINSALAPIVNASDSLLEGNTPTGESVTTAEEERDYTVSEEGNARPVDTDNAEYKDVTDAMPY